MKENRFIELLNLYIDRQITAAETAELEAELQGNPKRQAVYRQYCRIHTATKQVYESFRAVAADQPLPQANRSGVIELFETRRRRMQWAYYAAGFAAACLAMVFVMNRIAAPPAAPAEVAVRPLPAKPAAIAAVTPGASVIAEPAEEAAPSLATLQNAMVTVPPDYAAMLAALREQDEERASLNESLRIGRVQPLFDDNLFEPVRLITTQEQRVFRSPQATPASAQQSEFSAFQFQR